MGRPRINLTGKQYGLWTVLEFVEYRNSTSRYKALCAGCGTIKEVLAVNLKQGDSLSCFKCAIVTHGAMGTRTYKSWESMKARCNNPNRTYYRHYGGRGITVCERWQNSYENFLADMGERPIGKSLDRIDVNGNYEPSNCKWSTQSEQLYNRRAEFKKDVSGAGSGTCSSSDGPI
jgi:hypothetical protein